MRFSTLITSLAVAFVPAAVQAVRLPGADIPLFHLVASSQTPSVNMLPLRTNGGTNGGSSLAGSGPIGKFHFFQGFFQAVDTTQNPPVSLFPSIGFTQISSAACSTFGPVSFFQGGSSNKCARSGPFYISSDQENSQLGAKLVFNWQGAFYSCGVNKDIFFKNSPSDGPSGCIPVNLWTVPVEPVP